MRDAFVSGVGYSAPETFADRREVDVSKYELAFSAVKAAIDHAEIHQEDLDAAIFSTADGAEGTNRIERTLEALGQSLNIPILTVWTGGTAGGSSFKAAAELVQSERYDNVVVYGSPTFDSAIETQQFLNTAAPPLFEKPFIGALHMGAFYATAYMEEYGATEEDFARVAAKNYEHAENNPWAHRQGFTVDDVLESPMVVSPLRVLGACGSSSGSTAVIVSAKETVENNDNPPVRVEAIDTSTNTFLTGYRTYEQFHKLDGLADNVFEEAGIEDPYAEIDVAELFNPYIPFEFMEYEALGFCEPGEGPELLETGATMPDGDVAVNPSGGVISTNAGTQASVARHGEIALQLMGQAGDRQIPGSPEVGVAHSWGGNDGQFHSLAVLSR
jgi:acetyl-CoA C-acetyltransferase